MEDYEKKYKESLERAKEIIKYYKEHNRGDETSIEDLEQIFPELKNEDEKIRKALVRFHKSTIDIDGIKGTDILAWLEKQGNVDTVSYEVAENEKREFVGYGFLKCKGDFLSFKEGENYWLEYVGKDNYNVRSDNLLGQTFHITPQQLYTVFRPTTWLEKQGQTFTKKDVDDAYLKGVFDTKQGKHDARYKYFEEIIAADDIYQMSMNDAMVNEAKEKAAKALSKLCIGKLLGFEKQGEQKPVDKPISKDEILYQLVQNGTITAFDYLYLTGRFNMTEPTKDYQDIDPHFGIPVDKVKSNLLTVERAKEISPFMRSGFENESADKVEPKYHEGDWVVYECGEDSGTLQIKNIVDRTYKFTDDSTLNVVDEDILRLWSIKDAKDGDVVVDKSDGTIGIFQSIGHHPDGGSFNDPSYCFLHCHYDDGFFYADFENGNVINSDDLIPATKEQRDTLMEAMHDAGYEWDAEKKELKKIEEDGVENKKQIMSKMVDLVTAYVKQKSEPAWSDEDEHRVEDTIYYLDTAKKHYASTIELDACIDWLKSLKDRIGG